MFNDALVQCSRDYTRSWGCHDHTMSMFFDALGCVHKGARNPHATRTQPNFFKSKLRGLFCTFFVPSSPHFSSLRVQGQGTVPQPLSTINTMSTKNDERQSTSRGDERQPTSKNDERQPTSKNNEKQPTSKDEKRALTPKGEKRASSKDGKHSKSRSSSKASRLSRSLSPPPEDSVGPSKPNEPGPVMCTQCVGLTAYFYCESCLDSFCTACWHGIHKGGALAKHPHFVIQQPEGYLPDTELLVRHPHPHEAVGASATTGQDLVHHEYLYAGAKQGGGGRRRRRGQHHPSPA